MDDLDLNENTIVMFASDNGSAYEVAFKGMEDSDARNRLGGHPIDINKYPLKDTIYTNGEKAHYPNGILKGTKQTAWEGGVRTPFIARWPNKFPAGEISDQLFALNDVMPSIAGILEFELSEAEALDGYNLLQVLKGEKEGLRKSVVIQSSNNIFGLRMDNWKFIDASNQESADAIDELYDLSKDPSESNNLIESNPDVAKMMKHELFRLMNSKSSNSIGYDKNIPMED